MRWDEMRRSENVEDRTSGGGGFGGGGFGIGGIPLGGGALLLIVVVSLLFGVNPLELLSSMSGSGPVVQEQRQPAPGPGRAGQADDSRKEFVARILGDTEDFWGKTFQSMGSRYAPPRLVLYRGATRSACGIAREAVGPFYCPGDREVYLDTAFFDELRTRFGAPGDFAAAYVIAHEIGHHVQNSLGTMQQFDAQVQRMDARGRNQMSVRLELQADCYAGVWGASAQKRGLIDTSDIDAGIRAAQAVGDDRLQRQSQGTVVPDSFTHGSSEQRARWFKTGLSSGDPRSCDTFSG
ncbi:MAG TPA: neutral zinc metallopeptidase [Casimicrobiaceae bacterium]|nr:neutral zinc metallopeptidase [Casimicrobiaceae bacterium]